MAYSFGVVSESRLADLHPDLVKVVRRAMSYQIMDFSVNETARSPAQAAANAAKGCGIIHSKHIRQEDGFAHAVDLIPHPLLDGGKSAWNDNKRFNVLAGAMLAASKELNIPIRWGGNWDGDNNFRDNSLEDLPHFELPGA